MTHFGMFCPPATGHLDPVGALGRELIQRGHRVTVIQIPDVESKVRSEQLNFCPIGQDIFPLGSKAIYLEELGRREGLSGVRYSIDCAWQLAEVMCRQGPDAIRESKIDFMLVDQNEPAAGTVAEHLDIPFITLCTSVPINREPCIPPPFTLWPYSTSLLTRARNALAYRFVDWLLSPITKVLNHYRYQWHLPLLKSPDESFSKLAQLSQMTEDFDFPRSTRPMNFHYFGPFCFESLKDIPFPFDRLNGKPLVYASLGTLQNRQTHIFKTIAEACAPLQIQLVLSLGHQNEIPMNLPGCPLIVDYAPQLELLAKAHAVITHAGTNTTMGALRFGVPMVAMPITNDQPGTAARLERTGAGAVIPLQHLNASRLRSTLEQVMSKPSFRKESKRLQNSIEKAGGVQKAADIIEIHSGRAS